MRGGVSRALLEAIMKIILGIDVGSSTTKIVTLDEAGTLLKTAQMWTSDTLTSIFGSAGRILHDCGRQLQDVEKVMLTGVGGSFLDGDVFGIPTIRVTEFEALGTGGLYLTGLDRAVICSIGTGTSLVSADGGHFSHVGGSAVGGGTLMGLSKRLFGITDFEAVERMASEGNLKNVDWGMNEITRTQLENLPDIATASNLGKMRTDATDGDVALGIFNMIYQTAGTLAVFACRNGNFDNAVFTGSLSYSKMARYMLVAVGEMYGIRFEIPKNGVFATAIGAARLGLTDAQPAGAQQ
jgi:type II pantothenate kinase